MTGDRLRTSYDAVASAYAQRFVDELAGKPGDRSLLSMTAASCEDPVLDVGCGPGHVGAAMRALGRRVVGVDTSEAMAGFAAGTLDAATVADMLALPVRSGTAGGVVAFYSVIHVARRDLRLVFREFARVLRPGGRVLVSAHEGRGSLAVDEFLDTPVPFSATLYRLDELTSAASAAGLEVVDAIERDPYPSESETRRLYVHAVRSVA